MKVSFDALCELYMMNLLTLKRARDHMPNLKKHYDTPSFAVGDLVLLKNRNSSALQTKYLPNYRIVKKVGDRAVDLQDNFGNIHQAHIDDIQTMYPVNFFLSYLPPTNLFGRTAKYINDPRTFHNQLAKIPNISPTLLPKTSQSNTATPMSTSSTLIPATHPYNLRSLNKNRPHS